MCLLSVAPFVSEGQTREEKKTLKKARKSLKAADYPAAKALYSYLLEIQSENADYNFEMGLTYYHSEVNKEASVEYFEKALKHTSDTIEDRLYYLGRAYQYAERFDDAIAAYNRYKDLATHGKSGALNEANRYITMCNYGKKYAAEKNNQALTIENLQGINTEYPEYTPLLSKDENQLIFTARKRGSTGGKFYHDDKYYEDIYVSNLVDGEWTNPAPIDRSSSTSENSNINTDKHDAAIALSADEKKLFIYRDKDIWLSQTGDDGKWQKPEEMDKNLNSKSGKEMSVYLSADEKTMFVVSTRKEGFGGRDIYVSKKQNDNSWGALENLGPTINTPYDEDAPFLSPDGQTLYFSSTGHSTIGGYDVFKSTFNEQDRQWTEPVNLGPPVNTAADDIYYILNNKETVAYYASSRKGGTGEMDIYRINLERSDIPFTEVRGLVLAGESKLPIGANIQVTNTKTGEDAGTFTADAASGKYLMVLPPGENYLIEIQADNYQKQQHEITLPKQCDFYQMFQEVHVEYIEESDGRNEHLKQQTTFHNALFDINKETATAFELDNIPFKKGKEGLISDTEKTGSTVTGRIMHNEKLPAQGITVYLANKAGTVLYRTRTNETGFFNFYKSYENDYQILFDETDLRKSFYGEEQEERGIIIKGSLYRHALPGDDKIISEPIEGAQIILVDNHLDIVNFSTSGSGGYFTIDNLPLDQDVVMEANDNMELKKKLDISDPDVLYSAFLKTLDEYNSLGYKKHIEIIDIDIEFTADDSTGEDKGISEEDLLVFKNILFDFDEFFLRNASQEELDKIFRYLADNKDLSIEIAGHADSIGSEFYNKALSEKRAVSAVQYLREKGIEQERVAYKHFGENKPIAPNSNPDGSDNPEGRQLNRRCEFKIATRDYACNIVLKF